MLLGKGKGARILDKKRDSGKVVKLVEELRQAILIYQVGTIGSQRSNQADVFGIDIATTVNRQPGDAVGCKLPPNIFIIRTDGWLTESSLLSMHFWNFARYKDSSIFCSAC